MKCPKCGGDISAWPWHDGGFKGVVCDVCDQEWWSESMADAFDESERAAVRAVLAAREFPADAKTAEQRQKESDLVSNLLYYDRKEDEELDRDDIANTIRSGRMTVDRMVEHFRKKIEEGVKSL